MTAEQYKDYILSLRRDPPQEAEEEGRATATELERLERITVKPSGTSHEGLPSITLKTNNKNRLKYKYRRFRR